MPFVKSQIKRGDWELKDNQFILSDEYMEKNWCKFKKLTGSRLASILGLNEYTSEVQAWCEIVKIFKAIPEKMYTDAGQIIEPLIKNEVVKKFGTYYISFTPDEIGYDYFAIKDPILGGIPDGQPITKKGKIDYEQSKGMLEIKTASLDSFERDKQGLVKRNKDGVPIIKEKGANKKKWFKGKEIIIPENYLMQLDLYLSLENQEKGLFAICFLEPEDYAHPELIDLSERTIVYVEHKLDKKRIDPLVKRAKAWYMQYIVKGVSPKLTPQDLQWFNKEMTLVA